MPRNIAYLRVSTDRQELNNQRLEILEYANRQGWQIDHFFELEISSRRSPKERRIDELLDGLEPGDTIIVAELSRLGRSTGQVIGLVNEIAAKKARLVILKQGLDLKPANGQDMTTKVMVTIFSLLAELERDLISERTKAGLARARAEGKLIGRPKGWRGSKLDGREGEIGQFLAKKVSKASIAKIVECSPGTLDHFIKSRGLGSC